MNDQNNRTTVGIGDEFSVDGDRLVVIDNNNGRLITAGTDDCRIESFYSTWFFEQVKDGYFVKNEESAASFDESDVPEEAVGRAVEIAQELEKILEDNYPAWDRMFRRRTEKEYFSEAAERLGVSDRQVKRYMKTYLLSSRNVFSLVDHRHCRRCGTPNSTLLPTGPAFYTGKRSSVYNTFEVEKQLKEALAIFKKTLCVAKAHEDILYKYYSTPVTQPDGDIKDEFLPEEECLSYKRVYRYITDHLGELTVKEYIAGQRELRNNHRPLPGNSQTGVPAIGQHYQMDECELIGRVVSEKDPTKEIGKAVVYAVIDVKADIFVGYYVGLKNNSYSGFCEAMISMLEPHENQTGQVGVHCTPYEFPSMVMPKSIWADHGSEYESKALKAACNEVGIRVKLVPVACGSFKGLVENVFKQIQGRMRQNMINAGIPRKEMTPSALRKAAEEACLTMKDYREIVSRVIIELNLRPRDGLHPDLEQLEEGAVMSPAEIYRKEREKFPPENVTPANRDTYLFAFLGRKRKFKISRAGIEYTGHQIRFFTHESWFIHAISRKTEWDKLEVRYDDRFIDQVYVRYEGRFYTVPLSEDREEQESLKGLSWDEYDALSKAHKQKQRKAKWQAKRRKAETGKAIEKTVSMSQQLKEEAEKNTEKKETKKARKEKIRETRAEEKAYLEAGENEVKNRMLDDFGENRDARSPMEKAVGGDDVGTDAAWEERSASRTKEERAAARKKRREDAMRRNGILL